MERFHEVRSNEKPPKEYVAEVQTTTRPDHVWPEVWTKIGQAAQNREKQEREIEKSKLDNDLLY